MASCDPRSYSGVTAQIWMGLQQKLQGVGISLTGESGTVEGPMGLVMEYDYLPEQEQLHLHAVERSFIVPCSQIDRIIEQGLGEFGWQGGMSKG